MMTPTFTAVFGAAFVDVLVWVAEEALGVLAAVVDEDVGVAFEDIAVLGWDVGVGVADVVVELVVCRSMLD
jgi:hypothetical protein